ncbi:MAG: hypothetical protein QXG39_04860 [Candidatus Aenigmatarchaeota archaeon]
MVVQYLGIPVGFALGEWYLQNREKYPFLRTLLFPLEWSYQMGVATREKIVSGMETAKETMAKSIEKVKESIAKSIEEVKENITKPIEEVKESITKPIKEITTLKLPETKITLPEIPQIQAIPIPQYIQIPTEVPKVESNLPLILMLALGFGLIAVGVAK